MLILELPLTFCVITNQKEYLGGVILPGIRISMEALERETAQLPKVEVIEIYKSVGQTTIESIQIGLFQGHKSIVEGLSKQIILDVFNGEKPILIGTGGYSALFKDSGIFDEIISDLVLHGIFKAYKINGN